MALPDLTIHGELCGTSLPVVIDVEGGDYDPANGISPAALVSGALAASKAHVNVLLVGRESTVGDSGLPYVVSETIVPMGTDDKLAAIRNHATSVNVAGFLVANGLASGFTSPGDTAAMVGAAGLRLGRYDKKTPLIADMPGSLITGGTTRILDVGAWPQDITAEDLACYGVMGAVYSQLFLETTPRVALLSNGSEGVKGTDALKIAAELLAGFGGNYALLEGFVEGNGLNNNSVDVAVVDGFAGNLLLKAAEGAGRTIIDSLPLHMQHLGRDANAIETVIKDLVSLEDTFNPNATGGAAILGVMGNAVVLHGNSTALAAERALHRLHRMADLDFQTDLATALSQFNDYMESLPADLKRDAGVSTGQSLKKHRRLSLK